MAGLDADGLVIKRTPEVISGIVESERELIDPNINVDEDTVLGQLNNIVGSAIGEVWALTQAVYDAFNIQKAEGKNLDDLAALRGVTRARASRSSTNSQQFVGNNGTLVPAGAIFANPISGDRFSNPVSITLDANAALSVDLSVANVLDSTQYSITVSNTEYTYTSSISATATEIVNAFETKIDDDVDATWSASVDGTTLTISSDNETTISVVVITYISVDAVTVQGRIEAQEFGDIVAPAGSITSIVSIIPGLTSTTNLEQLILGRDEETDEELRDRVAGAGNSDCTGTIPSIETALENNVSGVSSAVITENTTTVTDVDGRPPHSYEIVVVGGDDQDVGQEIWRTKPAGIALYGNTNVIIQASNGNNRSIDFTRATAINIAVRMTYTRYDEESFPASGEDLMRAAVVDHINDLGIGVDVIVGRMFGPIYNSTPGIDTLVVETQTLVNPGDAPNPANWDTVTIPVASNEFASTTLTDVTAVDATP